MSEPVDPEAPLDEELAALDIPEEVGSGLTVRALYLATIKDDVFEIGPPGDGFEPRAFGLRGLG